MKDNGSRLYYSRLTDGEKNLYDRICEALLRFEPALSIHAFRITPGPRHTNLIFDVVVPYGFRHSDSQVCEELEKGIKQLSPRDFPVIQVDHSYVDSRTSQR